MLRIIACITATVLVSHKAAAAEPRPDEAVRQFLDKFCSAELRGDAERYEFARWTTPSDDPERGVFIATWNEFAIVTECTLASVEVRNAQGRATLVCHRIGSSTGKSVLLQENAASEDVPLAIRYDKGRWWIIDPPAPRVHVDALIESYEGELADFSPGWERGATEARKRVHESLVNALAGLRNIRLITLGEKTRSIPVCGK